MKQFRRQTFMVIFSLFGMTAFAQVKVSGTVLDTDNSGLPGAIIKVQNSDSTVVANAVTDANGNFTLTLPANSKFVISSTYISLGTRKQTIQTTNEPLVLKTFRMKEEGKNLAEVEIKTVQQRGEQKGDTTQFNAGAYKTNPDATAEDLIKKMPGVTSDNSGVKVNGETVQKVLVDGKPFYGDDPSATLKNLPADMIDKVEVFDKMSDQSAFTGFNDGDQQKTINLVTKKAKAIGQFGRVYAGAGADENQELKYNAGATVNNFNGAQKISVLLLSNNVNQQNFTSADLSGSMGSQSGRQGGQGGGRGGSTLMTSPQNGITTTQAAGLNYTDEWGKKVIVSGSYFFNSTENLSNTELFRNYFTKNQLQYHQISRDRNFNINNRANLRFEYTIDSANKIIITPSFSGQNNDARSLLGASNIIGDNALVTTTSTDSKILSKSFDFNNNILYQHKFSKRGRTVSLGLNNQVSQRDNSGKYYSYNNYSDTSSLILDQRYGTDAKTNRFGGNLSYTEPLNLNSQLLFSYNPSVTNASSDKQTSDYDYATGAYSDLNTKLSNTYANISVSQKAGMGYRYQKNKISFSFGADAQEVSLNGDQTYPTATNVNMKFRNILPNAQLNYKYSKTKNLRVNYRSSTNIPSVSQLQNVVDVSNPLLIKTGNDSLKQTFDNSVFARFGGFDPVTSKNIMLFVNASHTDNYITNATFIAAQDSVVRGYTMKAGSQLIKPVNLDGYNSARLYAVYGFPFKAIKSNFNLNGGLNYSRTPSLLNNYLNYANSLAGNAGFAITSNVSESLDFTLSYNGNYTDVKNSRQTTSNNNFYSQSAGFKVNYIIQKSFVINSDITHTMYRGLTQSFNQEYFLWNAYIAYKFLKNKALEAKISMYDILNQNRSISRTVTASYTEDNFTTVLRRYALFTLTYTFRNFKSGSAPKVEEGPPGMPGGPPPGTRPNRQDGGF